VVEAVARHAVEIGLGVIGLAVSSLLGPQGNREFFLHLSVNGAGENDRRGVNATNARNADIGGLLDEVFRP
jgi:hypothetical protein